MHIFSNIIYLNFKKSISFTNKALKLIAESYLDLRYFNIFLFYNSHLANHIFKSLFD